MKNLSQVMAATLASIALIPASSMAQDSLNQGYVVDSRNAIVVNSTGLCWHDSDWTPARAVEGCDPTIKAPAPVAVVAPKAAVVAIAEAPAPLPVKPVPQKVSFSADALFAFDKSVINPKGKEMLNDFVQQLNGVSYETILITGHADRLGSSGYNQKLSERRANAVKEYLVAKNIPANQMQASGQGKTQPVTKAGECTGAKSAKLIACLQPDRRVDIEMKGSTTKVVSQ